MALRARLHRLERQTVCAGRTEPRREGPESPDPSCPQRFDPAEWASRKRIGRCLEQRMKGELRPSEYLPDMTEEERTYVDRLEEVVTAFTDLADEQKEATPCDEMRHLSPP
jgi:hypothetical protein